MTKWIAVAVLVAAYLAVSQGHIDEFIRDHNSIQTVNGLQCSRLEGSSKGCLACYHCDHEEVKNKRVRKLQFSYSNCTRDQLCCIPTSTFTAKATDNDCGVHNPEGDPRVQRPSLRAVLEREYPWRAWVYSQNPRLEEPLCAASYIDFSTRALLTTASCVRDYQPSTLRVKFTKTQVTPYLVDDYVIHEGFSASQGGNVNDIALLILKEKPERRVRSVCLESKPALADSSCVIVSDSETSINVIMPQRAKCANEHLKSNVTCSYMNEGDYIPERGAGLYCLSKHFTPPAYTLQGIYQRSQGSLAVYTSVPNYNRWVFRITNNIKRHFRP